MAVGAAVPTLPLWSSGLAREIRADPVDLGDGQGYGMVGDFREPSS